jgi:hypothetical protein
LENSLFPEHADKKLYGIIAAVDMSEMLKKRVLEAGFYVARIQDETLCWSRQISFKRSVFNKAISFIRSYAVANQNAAMG